MEEMSEQFFIVPAGVSDDDMQQEGIRNTGSPSGDRSRINPPLPINLRLVTSAQEARIFGSADTNHGFRGGPVVLFEGVAGEER
jgi:hypothetical protein